jgi:pimeloyl-ACP methyl ester carboxylesterase
MSATKTRQRSAPRARRRPSFEPREIELHGHRVVYRLAGEGPLLVLVHGITSTSEVWRKVIGPLSERFCVIAPDLLGHGQSAKPRGDYSMGAFASGLRDLLMLIGRDRGTFVGHSLGGGVVLQLAYQFPEMCERLVLVSSGGLGDEVHVALRAAALPGAEAVLPLLTPRRLQSAATQGIELLKRAGLADTADAEEFARGLASLSDPEARDAFIHTVRAVVDPRGQRVSARDRLYLASELPTLFVWGERDRIIPPSHGRAAQSEVPGSRLELLRDAGHFPQLDKPETFVEVLTDFIAATEPASVTAAAMRERLREGSGGEAN